MYIIAPVSRVNEVQTVIDAGADEIFCGLLTDEEKTHSTNTCGLNRRSEPSSNLSSFSELKEVITIAHGGGVPVSLTLNVFYNAPQLRTALKYLEQAIKAGIDNILVSDIGLLSAINNNGYPVKIHISSCTSIFNSETIRFYLQFNPQRIVLNRQLTLTEIESFKQTFPDVGLEVFLLNEKCYYVDGLCTFLHGRKFSLYNSFARTIAAMMKRINSRLLPPSVMKRIHHYAVKNSINCCAPYVGESMDYEGGGPCFEKILFNTPQIFVGACGVCALHDFSRMGIHYFKISGRSLLTNKIADIKLVREALRLLKEGMAKEEFCKKVKGDLMKKYSRQCAPQYCYY